MVKYKCTKFHIEVNIYFFIIENFSKVSKNDKKVMESALRQLLGSFPINSFKLASSLSSPGLINQMNLGFCYVLMESYQGSCSQA